MLWDLRRGDSRQAATAAGAHSKRYEFPERLFTLLELAVVHRERSFFFGRARGVQGRNCSGIGNRNDVAQWKRTGQKGLCAFASDAGGVRGQELLWHRKRRAQGAYRRRTLHIVLQLTRNKECWIILAGTVFQSAAGTCVLEGSSCVLSPRNCPFLVWGENGTGSVT